MLSLRPTSALHTAFVRPRASRRALVTKAIAVPPEYGYVMASVAVSAAIVQWQAVRVGMARRKYGVQLPKMYADGDSTEAKTFNCTQVCCNCLGPVRSVCVHMRWTRA
eukprot:GHUV01054978.1.p3 GENE.GHUV01054978.1~~GHUV01054978.1.p3  ORF type:complete len:108 (-),score=10.88 GHUV01054978.1:521-844(-)